MYAFKGFNKDLKCRDYQFEMGIKAVTEDANCVKNGFHCAENPLTCFVYYPNVRKSIYCLVEITGDMDEDDADDKISCTELTPLKRLSVEELLLEGAKYIARWPYRKNANCVQKETGTGYIYAVVRGKNPIVKAEKNCVIALIKEKQESPEVEEVAIARVPETGTYKIVNHRLEMIINDV